MIARLLITLLVVLSPSASALDGLRSTGEARVAEVIDGDTVVLETPVLGAKEVRLVGVQAPKLALGRKNFQQWALAPESRDALEALVLNKRVSLFAGSREKDRHGRLLAHLRLVNGEWVQGVMLEQGWARVYTFADNREQIAEMLAIEDKARRAFRGIWRHPDYRAVEALPHRVKIGDFQIIKGRVLRAQRVKKRMFLNFDENWRNDFTVLIPAAVDREFKKLGIDPLSFEGRKIRVRGWVRSWNGPLVELTHPEQIEVIKDGE